MWVARDKDGELYLYTCIPEKLEDYYREISGYTTFGLDNSLFPELTFDDGPKKIEICLDKGSLIEEICEWLRDNLYDTEDVLGNKGIDSFDCYSVTEFIEKFKRDINGNN